MQHRSSPTIRRSRGLTLIESLTVLTVLTTLLASAAPAMLQLRQRQRLQGIAQTLMTDLQQARSESVQRGDMVQFRFFRHDSGSCYVIHSGKSGDCLCDRSGRASCQAGAQILRSHWIPTEQAASIRPNVSNLSFQARQGIVTPTASIDVVGDDGLAIRHVVSIAGRVRSCALQGVFGQLPACKA